MLIATVCVGDTHLSLTKVVPIHKNAAPFYRLEFLDLPTRNRAHIYRFNENSAIKLFAAWLAADAPDLTSYMLELRRELGKSKHDRGELFLP